MKKFFITVGVIFVALIVLGAIGIGFIAIRGTALDNESKGYAETAIPAIVATWNKKEILDRASPEFRKAVTDDQLDRILRWASSLGRLTNRKPAKGGAVMSATSQNGRMTTAQYVSKATFEKGEADVTIKLIKHGDQWQILGFNINSPQLVPK